MFRAIILLSTSGAPCQINVVPLEVAIEVPQHKDALIAPEDCD